MGVSHLPMQFVLLRISDACAGGTFSLRVRWLTVCSSGKGRKAIAFYLIYTHVVVSILSFSGQIVGESMAM